MPKVLNRQRIDGAINAPRRGAAADGGGASSRQVRTCNFRTAGQLSNENARVINALHEAFARNVAYSLGACLGAACEMGLSSVEQFSFRDFLASMQESGYLVALQINPLGVTAMLQVDNDLVFPIIDLLLGGTGASAPEAHELTEIDENVLEAVTQLILRQLETTWQALGASIAAGGSIKPVQVQQLFSPADRMLLLAFEASTADIHGRINLLVPASFGNVLLRQISTGPGKPKSRVAYFPKPTLRERVRDCEFTATVELTRLCLPVRDFLALQQGSVVRLNVPVKNPSFVTIEGRELFEAVPVRSGTRRAAQLVRSATQTRYQDVRP